MANDNVFADLITPKRVSTTNDNAFADLINPKSVENKIDTSKKLSDSSKKVKPKENIIFRGLDQINRDQYGVINVIDKAITEGNYDFVRNFAKGLSLEEKTSTGAILKKQFGVPESKLMKAGFFVAGIVGDTVTDPKFYLGVGLLNRAGELLKAGSTAEKFVEAARAVGKTGKVKKVATVSIPFMEKKAIPLSEKIVDPLSMAAKKAKMYLREEAPVVSEMIDSLRTISTRLRPKGVDPIVWERILMARDKARNLESAISSKSFTAAKSIANEIKKLGVNETEVSDIVQKIEKASPLEKEYAQLASKYTKELEQMYSNIPGKKIIKEEGYQYLPHLVEDIPKSLKKEFNLMAKEFTTKSKLDIQRSFYKFTDGAGTEHVLNTKTRSLFRDGQKVGILPTEKVNKLVDNLGKKTDIGRLSQITINDANKALGAKVFSTDIPKLVAYQGTNVAKVVGGNEFFKHAEKIGSKSSIGKNGEALFESTYPELKGRYYKPEVLEQIDKTYKFLTDVNEQGEFLKLYRNVQNAWKGTATFLNPAFHTRNAISNMMQAYDQGLKTAGPYITGLKIQLKLMVPSKFGKLTQGEAKLLSEFEAQGLQKVGQMSGDISKSLDNELMGVFDMVKNKKPFSALNKMGGNVGETIENNAKLALFIQKRNEGLSAFDAGRLVKKTLFDYSDITKAEKGIKNVLPFYTWSRKNIPLQIDTIINNPAAATKVIKFKNNVEVLTGPDKDQELLAPWIRNSSPIFLGKKDGVNRYVSLSGFVPIADLNALSTPAQTMLNLLSPILKTPAEQALNRRFFVGKGAEKQVLTKQEGLAGVVPYSTVTPFGGYGEKDYLYWRIPGRLEHLARLFRPISEIEKLVGNKNIDRSTTDKILNYALGANIIEQDEKQLMRMFKVSQKEKITDIKYQMNALKRIMKQTPARKEDLKDDINLLKTLYRKTSIENREEMRRQRDIKGTFEEEESQNQPQYIEQNQINDNIFSDEGEENNE